MPKEGVEPTWACAQQLLRLPRMPFRHFGKKNIEIGGAEGDRTPDPLHAMQVLSQLSYSPIIL